MYCLLPAEVEPLLDSHVLIALCWTRLLQGEALEFRCGGSAAVLRGLW